jgi:DNA-binding NarL/FixJ family response regulator
MKILLIEDTQFKIENLVTFLKESFGWEDITIKKSYNAALNEILSESVYDLIILDISIPNFDTSIKDYSGDFMPSGGKFLLNQIYLREVNSKVIVVTLFENFDDGNEIKSLDKMFCDYYNEIYLGYVLYNSDQKWKNNLDKIIRKHFVC